MTVLHGIQNSLFPEGQQQGTLQLIEKFRITFHGDQLIVLNTVKFCKLPCQEIAPFC